MDREQGFIKVDFRPLCVPKFTRTDKKHWCKHQSTLRDKMTRIAVYGPQKGTDFFRICDGRMMLLPWLRQSPPKVSGRITFRPACSNGITEYLSGNGPDPVRRFQRSPVFYTAQNCEQFRSFDIFDGLYTYPREQIPL